MRSLLLLSLLICAFGLHAQVEFLSKYNLDDKPVLSTNEHLQGLWKLTEDTDRNNYFVVERDGDLLLSITYMNRGGDNRGLEHASAFFSEVHGVKFLNAPYQSFFSEPEFQGRVLLRVDELSEPRCWSTTFTLVTDPNLHKMQSSKQLRQYVAQHMKDPGFYGKQLHFRKKFEFNTFH